MKAINYYIIIEKIKEEPREVGGLVIAEAKDTEIRYNAEINTSQHLLDRNKR